MQIPVEVIFSQRVKGGVFEGNGSTGEWWCQGKLVASWKRGKNGDAIVTWHAKRPRNGKADQRLVEWPFGKLKGRA